MRQKNVKFFDVSYRLLVFIIYGEWTRPLEKVAGVPSNI